MLTTTLGAVPAIRFGFCRISEGKVLRSITRYVVGDGDLVIPPSVQLMMAHRAKAHVTHVSGSHPSMIRHPEATVDAIVAAAHATEITTSLT